MNNSLKTFKMKLDDCLPVELTNKLYNFQKQGIEFGLRHCGRILIGDEMVCIFC